MFFPKKIKSIRTHDRVLEIGPGATPHPRSNEFLELKYEAEQDKIAQRGGGRKDAEFGGRLFHYYDGHQFPFEDGQFDYVICSHVVEHVPDPVAFLNEIFRVGKGRGYLEYPLITYEYLYDYEVHLNFVKFNAELNLLRYLPKKETVFSEFAAVSSLLNQTLEKGWDELCAANKQLFFEGFEFNKPFDVRKTETLELLLPSQSLIVPKKALRKLTGQILNKLGL